MGDAGDPPDHDARAYARKVVDGVRPGSIKLIHAVGVGSQSSWKTLVHTDRASCLSRDESDPWPTCSSAPVDAISAILDHRRERRKKHERSTPPCSHERKLHA